VTEVNKAFSRNVPVVVLAVIGAGLAVAGQFLLNGRNLLGLAVAFLAVALWTQVSRDGDDPDADRRLLDVALAIALGFHFWNLSGFPSGLFYDEAANALEAQKLVMSADVSIWSDNLSGRPTLFLYVIGLAQQFFGDTAWTLRRVVVVVNIVTTLLLVWAISPLVGARVARMAGVIFGFSFYHLLFSRFVYEASISSLPLVLAVGCLVRTVTSQRRLLWWIGWGAALGVGLWTYAAFRLVPLLFVPVVAAVWWHSPGARRRVFVGAVAGVVTAAVVASPLLAMAWDQPERFNVRIRETTVLSEIESGSWEPLLRNVLTYGLMFVHNPQTSNQIYQFPALALSAAAMLWVGVGMGVGSVVRGRDRWWWLLLFYWWLAGLLPAVITASIEAPHWSRTLYALPAVTVIAAIALDRISRLGGSRARPFLTIVLLAAVLLTEARAAERFLFDERRTIIFFTPVASEAGRRARAALSEGDGVLASEELVVGAHTAEVFRFHAGEFGSRVRPIAPWQSLPEPHRQGPLTILLTEGDHPVAELVEQLYPSAELRTQLFPWEAVMLSEFRLPERMPVPRGREAGLLVRMTGDYTVHLPEGQSIRIGPWELVDGDDLWLPAGSWDVYCSSECAEIEARFEGPETFVVADRLVPDPLAGRGLIACYRDQDGPPSFQFDRVIDANGRGLNRPEWSISRAGEIEVPETGIFRFEIASDDGSRLWIDDELVIDNWGFHGSITKSAEIELTSGRHRIQIDFFQGEGGYELIVLWKPPSDEIMEPLPPGALRPPADLESAMAKISVVRAMPVSILHGGE